MKKIYLALTIIFSLSCANDKKEEKTELKLLENTQKINSSNCPDYLMERKDNNYNITILIDLSSRISKANQQQRDSSNIYTIANTFNDHIKTKKLGLLKDKIQVLFHPIPNNSNINQFSEQLKISYEKGVSKNKEIPKTDELYKTLPSKIYNLAKEDFEKNHNYPGSDTWSFFKDDINDQSIDDCFRNIVIILTDGYMFYQNNLRDQGARKNYLLPKTIKDFNLTNSKWEETMVEKNIGFIPANSNLDDIEVLVLGIDSENDKNPYEIDVITKFWENWFKDMGVKKYKVKKTDLPSNMESVIKEFLQPSN